MHSPALSLAKEGVVSAQILAQHSCMAFKARNAEAAALVCIRTKKKGVQKLEATLSPLLFKGWLSFARVGESSAFQGPCLERYLHTERHKEQGLAVSEGNVRSLSGIPRGRQPKRELVVQGRGDDLRGQEGTIWNAEFRVQGLGERGKTHAQANFRNCCSVFCSTASTNSS